MRICAALGPPVSPRVRVWLLLLLQRGYPCSWALCAMSLWLVLLHVASPMASPTAS